MVMVSQLVYSNLASCNVQLFFLGGLGIDLDLTFIKRKYWNRKKKTVESKWQNF